LIVKPGIQKENITGWMRVAFPTGNRGRKQVVGARGTKTQHMQGGQTVKTQPL